MANGNDVAQALGDLQGTVRTLTEQWRMQDLAAANGRRALYERFEAMSSQMGTMAGQVSGLTEDVARISNDIESQIMPTIEAVKHKEAHRDGRKDGVIWVGRLIWAAIAATAAAVGFAIHEALLYIGHGPFHP